MPRSGDEDRKHKADADLFRFAALIGHPKFGVIYSRALISLFKHDPPAGAASLTFVTGTTVTVTVGVEPNMPNRNTYEVTAQQTGGAETPVATSAGQPTHDVLGSNFTGYDASKSITVKLTYRDSGAPKTFVTTFAANTTGAAQMLNQI